MRPPRPLCSFVTGQGRNTVGAEVLEGFHKKGTKVNDATLNTVLSNYWPHSPWLSMTNTAGLGGTNVTFALNNAAPWKFSVLMSTNLADWNYLGPATPLFQFFDTNAPSLPGRYYRLRWP